MVVAQAQKQFDCRVRSCQALEISRGSEPNPDPRGVVVWLQRRRSWQEFGVSSASRTPACQIATTAGRPLGTPLPQSTARHGLSQGVHDTQISPSEVQTKRRSGGAHLAVVRVGQQTSMTSRLLRRGTRRCSNNHLRRCCWAVSDRTSGTIVRMRLNPSVVLLDPMQFGIVCGETDSPAHYRRRPIWSGGRLRREIQDVMGRIHVVRQGGAENPERGLQRPG